MIAKGVSVHLADNEWGNPLMQEVAEETFQAYPEADCVFVHEHAGWYLAWDRGMNIIGTANDAATVTPARKRFWDRFRDFDLVADIRRERPQPAEVACEVPA